MGEVVSKAANEKEEQVQSDGNQNKIDRYEIQLKGAGPTPYSRRSDGRKVLRSSIREFLCSEAMFYLDIPTTRAGVCITSDTTVERDPFYNGNVIQEKCTIVTRIAENFFRFGSFEIFISRGPSFKDDKLKKTLLDHVISYYPAEISSISENEERYSAFFKEIVRRTAKLVAQWQSVGTTKIKFDRLTIFSLFYFISFHFYYLFILIYYIYFDFQKGFVHGVLNTDNMSIMGVTIDYGPFGFMEFFDPDFVPNGSDHSGRYSYEKQPEVIANFCDLIFFLIIYYFSKCYNYLTYIYFFNTI